MELLTEPQRTKLQALEEALKLAPVLSEAQAANLIGGFAYPPIYFAVPGRIVGPVAGCWAPVPVRLPGNRIPAPWVNVDEFAETGTRK